MKELFEYLKEEFIKYPSLFKADGEIDSQLGMIEMKLASYLKANTKLQQSFTGSVSLKLNDRFSYLISCDLNFHGSFRSPIVTNTKYNSQVFKGHDISKDQHLRLVLDRCTEDIVRNALSALTNLCRLYIIDGFKNDMSTTHNNPFPSHLQMGFVEKLDTWLGFEYQGNPKIHFFYNPKVKSGVSVPWTASTGPTTYGDDLDAITYGFHDIHYSVLRTLFSK